MHRRAFVAYKYQAVGDDGTLSIEAWATGDIPWSPTDEDLRHVLDHLVDDNMRQRMIYKSHALMSSIITSFCWIGPIVDGD